MRDPGAEMETREVEGFFAYRVAVGTVLTAQPNVAARVPALVLTIDFGPYGIKTTSAQLTRRYDTAALIGRQVAAVLNFPPKRVAGVRSEVLVLGALPEAGDVVLLAPDHPVPNGTEVG
jgi:tRNA-binding protein